MLSINERPRKRRRRRRTNRRIISFQCIIIIGIILWTVTTIVGWKIIGRSGRHNQLRGRQKNDAVWVHSDSQPFNDESIATHATHLIVVAGHSVLISGNVQNAAYDDSVWFEYDYQRNRGLPQAIVSHIQAGIQLAIQDEHSLLMFSGGETRAKTGPETEGGSYFRVADALNLWDGRDLFNNNDDEKEGATTMNNGNDINDNDTGEKKKNGSNTQQQQTATTTTTVRARTITEEYATDSFQNLLFSICRFYEITGSYPQKITMVSFTFKRQRFETLHASSIRWPLTNFHYVGVDPPSSTGFNIVESTNGEKNNSLLPYETDPYGCHTEILQQKRKERNPFARRAPYELTCPEMKDLLYWCGPLLIPKSQVPWG